MRENLPNKKIIFGMILILLGITLNQWLLASLFSPDKTLSFSKKILICFFDLSLILLGIFFITIKKKKTLFRILLVLFIFVCTLIIPLLFSEVYLSIKYHSANHQTSQYFQMKFSSKYNPFTIQYLHPFYYFFFPRDPDIIDKINNDVVSIDINGFRGAGPDKKGEKELAFILGGSAAFGHGTSSDQATISGHLNKLQSEYHFVNAGVPSWNSTQEFYRLSLELVHYRPSLIIVYDGFNDVMINYYYAYNNMNFPSGTPESYEYFEKQFSDIREHEMITVKGALILTEVIAIVFPRTASYLEYLLQPKKSKKRKGENESVFPDYLESSAKNGANVYLKNIELMTRMAKSYSSSLIPVWQPGLFQHKNISLLDMNNLNENKYFIQYLEKFHGYVFRKKNEMIELIDFSDIFDRYYDDVLLRDIFIDEVHLSDKGNEIIAKEIIALLKVKGLL